MDNRDEAKQVAELIALHEAIQPTAYQLGQGTCMIGRDPSCHIVIPQRIVSRLHARIERIGPRYILSDAESINGTFVNAQRITEPHLLRDNDELGLGAPTPMLHFSDPDPTVVASALRYDQRSQMFLINKLPLQLTSFQQRLLVHLYQHQGTVCSRESCAEAIWGRRYDPTVDAHALEEMVRKLRERLRQLDPDTDYIRVQRGSGYKFHAGN